MTEPVVWLDCSGGVSGDMLLAALYDAGVDVRPVIETLGLGAHVTFTETVQGGLRATRCVVESSQQQPLRTLRDLQRVLDGGNIDAAVASRARSVFERLAKAEARVHGVAVDDVHFHEVGAIDTVVDVVGVCAGLRALGVDQVVVSTVSLGGGTATTEHGVVPVPGPAVLELLRDSLVVAAGGPDETERATPTGVALLAEFARGGPMPSMRVTTAGVGAGARVTGNIPNVVRVVTGTTDDEVTETATVLEANVDDLDPRLWPEVIERLLAAGAADAWLTPIVMKKGRPAHVISALVATGAVTAVRDALFRETTTIGIRELAVTKTALDRDWIPVDVDGVTVRVKVARLGGGVVNATPEWEDVLTAARALDRPAKLVLAAAVAAAQHAQR